MLMGRGGEEEKGLGNRCRVTPSLRCATKICTSAFDWRVLNGVYDARKLIAQWSFDF